MFLFSGNGSCILKFQLIWFMQVGNFVCWAGDGIGKCVSVAIRSERVSVGSCVIKRHSCDC
jgi:hypothetical protein